MDRQQLDRDDIVQIAPGVPEFGRCLMIVTEVMSWGAHGYIEIPNRGPAFFRCPWPDMEPTGGSARWGRGSKSEEA